MRDGNCNTHFYTQYWLEWKDGEDIDFLKQYYNRIIDEVKPKTLAVEYLRKLHEEGNKIVLITARWETSEFDVIESTKNWISKNNIPCDKLVINAENKLIAVKQENVNVFIDDSFKNCKMVSDNGVKTYLIDTRTNKRFLDENIERVYSWPHLYMKLKDLNV